MSDYEIDANDLRKELKHSSNIKCILSKDDWDKFLKVINPSNQQVIAAVPDDYGEQKYKKVATSPEDSRTEQEEIKVHLYVDKYNPKKKRNCFHTFTPPCQRNPLSAFCDRLKFKNNDHIRCEHNVKTRVDKTNKNKKCKSPHKHQPEPESCTCETISPLKKIKNCCLKFGKSDRICDAEKSSRKSILKNQCQDMYEIKRHKRDSVKFHEDGITGHKYSFSKYKLAEHKHPSKLSAHEIVRHKRESEVLHASDDNYGPHLLQNRMNRSVSISPADPSLRPRGPLVVHKVSPTSVKLIWGNPSQEGLLKIEEYIVEKNDIEKRKWEVVDTVPARGDLMELIVDGLVPGRKYLFSVAASTALGVTEPLVTQSPINVEEIEGDVLKMEGRSSRRATGVRTSRKESVVTPSPTSSPTDLSSDPLKINTLIALQNSPTSALLKWDKSAKPVKKYVVAKKSIGRKSWDVVGNVRGSIENPEFVVSDLKHGRAYSFRVDTEGVLPPLVTEKPFTLTDPKFLCPCNNGQDYCKCDGRDSPDLPCGCDTAADEGKRPPRASVAERRKSRKSERQIEPDPETKNLRESATQTQIDSGTQTRKESVRKSHLERSPSTTTEENTKPEKVRKTEPGKEKKTKPEQEKKTKPEKEKKTKPGKEKMTKPEKEKKTKPEKEKKTKPEKEKKTKPEKGKKTKPEKDLNVMRVSDSELTSPEVSPERLPHRGSGMKTEAKKKKELNFMQVSDSELTSPEVSPERLPHRGPGMKTEAKKTKESDSSEPDYKPTEISKVRKTEPEKEKKTKPKKEKKPKPEKKRVSIESEMPTPVYGVWPPDKAQEMNVRVSDDNQGLNMYKRNTKSVYNIKRKNPSRTYTSYPLFVSHNPGLVHHEKNNKQRKFLSLIHDINPKPKKSIARRSQNVLEQIEKNHKNYRKRSSRISGLAKMHRSTGNNGHLKHRYSFKHYEFVDQKTNELKLIAENIDIKECAKLALTTDSEISSSDDDELMPQPSFHTVNQQQSANSEKSVIGLPVIILLPPNKKGSNRRQSVVIDGRMIKSTTDEQNFIELNPSAENRLIQSGYQTQMYPLLMDIPSMIQQRTTTKSSINNFMTKKPKTIASDILVSSSLCRHGNQSCIVCDLTEQIKMISENVNHKNSQDESLENIYTGSVDINEQKETDDLTQQIDNDTQMKQTIVQEMKIVWEECFKRSKNSIIETVIDELEQKR